MTWTTFSASLLPLVGVALGTAGTLIGQYLVARLDTRRDERQQREALRAERKEAIVGFFRASQNVERARDQISSGGPREAVELEKHVHELWLAKKIIELVCSAELAQAAHDYTLELADNARMAGREPSLVNEHGLRAAMVEMARLEMGYDGSPLKRRAAIEARESETITSRTVVMTESPADAG
ncbi:hypothetical protein OG851_43395 (plasmid) [Streptomyces sp. NBC_00161]|uniref:hypothetical protein n=1 Tax=Streptomyces sp. NBC_00161 TaxID=2975671 RepID=UPI003253DAF1